MASNEHVVKIKYPKIEFIVGDIAKVEAQAIVNAANRRLWMGAGVAGAIKRAGGLEIEQEAVAQGPVNVGDAVATSAGRLNAEYVIHAVAINDSFRGSVEIVAKAMTSVLEKADELKIRTLVIPALGTGVGGLSIRQAGKAMALSLNDYLSEHQTILQGISFILIDTQSQREFEREFEKALAVNGK